LPAVNAKGAYLSLSLFLFAILCPWSASECQGERLPVAASIFPVADWVKQVGGDHVDVITIIPPGASPHTFSLKPSQVKRISAARVFFMIGAGLESWTEKLVGRSPHTVMAVALADDVTLIYGVDRHRPEDVGHEPEDEPPGTANPHIWLDPENAKTMVERIADALGRADPHNKEDYRRNARTYGADLDALSHTIRSTVSGFRTKRYVSYHSAWDYFARRYGLESVGTIEASPGRHPTPRTVLHIVKQIRRYKIKAVFAEPQLNPKTAETIAREVKARVLMLDPVGGENIEGRDTYIGLMTYNLGILREGME